MSLFLPIGVLQQQTIGGGGGGGAAPVLESWAASRLVGSRATTLVCTQASGIQEDDLLVLVGVNDDTANFTPTFQTPSGWTSKVGYGSGAPDVMLHIFWKVATGSEGTVSLVTGNNTVEALGAYYFRFSGANLTDPFNVIKGVEITANSSHSIGSIATTVDKCLPLWVFGFDGAYGIPLSESGSGWTELHEQWTNVSGGGSHLAMNFGVNSVVSPAGATPSLTIGSSSWDGSTTVMFAIAPA